MLISINIIFSILFLHFIADFVLQSQWMALNKCKNDLALSLHVLVYTFGLGVGGFILITGALTESFFAWIFINGILHLIVDYITSKITSILWKLENKHWFFTVIGLDQFIHYFCLFGTFVLCFDPYYGIAHKVLSF